MSTRNDITGDHIRTKSNSKKYKDGWDLIFGKKDEEEEEKEDETKEEE